ncbi:M48 family metallopeptidase [Candidatus Peregrinibacteria bacterium]|nr:M48 family metallopeptidase [Candidatus Peregrinibacteria bacterium]MBI3816854.1 M48 family metallopeptidase [Candidatus Peregrinibacteria bacterium]
MSLPYRLERTRNRHSNAVYRDETIVIRLARNLSLREEQRHIENLLKRMEKFVIREERRTRIDPFRPLLEGASELTIAVPGGGSYRFTLEAGDRTRARRTTEGWAVTLGPGIRRARFHRFLWRLLSELELPRIRSLVHAINTQTLRVRVRGVKLHSATTLWGSCSHIGSIALNAVLLFLPQDMLEYVIVHELAHRIHGNHARAFWREVERACPEYDRIRRAMRHFSICSL